MTQGRFQRTPESWQGWRESGSSSPYSFPVRLWNLRKSGFVQTFRRPAGFRRFLRAVRIQPDGMAVDGIVATVPEWTAERFAWFAHGVRFRGTRLAPAET
jgi:hypothetical protein